MPTLAKLFRKLRRKGDNASAKPGDSNAELSQEDKSIAKPKEGQTGTDGSFETDATSLVSQHVPHMEIYQHWEGTDDWAVSSEEQNCASENIAASSKWKNLTHSSGNLESEKQRQRDIATVVTMLELGIPPVDFRLFSSRRITRVHSTSSVQDGIRKIDSFIDFCDNREVARKSHTFNEVDDPKKKYVNKSPKGTKIICEKPSTTDRPSSIQQTHCLETREDFEDGMTERRLSEKGQSQSSSSMCSINEDDESTGVGLKKSAQLCNHIHATKERCSITQRRTSRKGSKSSVERSESTIIQTTSGDSWGQENFQNLHPIARLRFQHLQSEETIPCYY